MDQDPTGAADGSDAELITRVRAGDRAAFGVLYTRHATAATNLARQFARSQAEVDDLVSESFARVLDALLGGRGPDSAFRAYLFTTLRNTAFDRSRKDSKLRFTDDVTVHETPQIADDPVVLELENALVAKAFGALPERWQTVLWHTEVERQSPAEVGVLMGMTANAVTSLAFRAREGLREAYLQAHLADTAAERCRATVDRLGAWARGGLSKRERTQVDAHLDECDRCRALAAELAEINTGLRGLLAPVLLGGAAAGYLATSSTGAAAPLVAAGATGAGGAVAGTGSAASGGSGSSGGGALGFLTRPWTLITAAAAVAAAAVIAVVVGVVNSGQPLADGPPPVVPVTGSAVTTSTAPVTTSTRPVTTSTRPVTTAAAPVTTPTHAPPSSPAAPPTTPSVQPSTTRQLPQVGDAPTTIPGGPAAPAPRTSTAQRTTPGATPTSSPTSSGTTRPTRTTPTPTSSTSSTTSSPVTTPPPTAKLSDPVLTADKLDVTAGAPATLTFSVTNAGDADSGPQTVDVRAPKGITVDRASSTTSPTAPALRRLSALLTGPTATSATTLECGADGCTYTVPAHQTATVTLHLSVGSAALPGEMYLTINGVRRHPLPVTVGPGLTKLQITAPDGGWKAGRTVVTALTARLQPGVTDAGTVTLPLRSGPNEDLWITDYPDACESTGTGFITCEPQVAAGAATFGMFHVTLLPSATGEQQIPVTLPGGRRGQVVGADGSPIDAIPLAPGGPIEMSGPFGAASVGSAAEYCPGPDRQSSPHSCIADARQWQVLDEPVSMPEAFSGHAAIFARLTWAVSETTASAPDSVRLLVDDGSTVPLERTAIPVDQAGGNNVDPSMLQFSADLVDPGLLTGHSTVRVLGLLPDGGDHHPRMAAWTLTVIWQDSEADTTVSAYQPGAIMPSDGSKPWREPDAPSGPVSRVTVALWGTDKTGDKSIAVGGTPIAFTDGSDSCLALRGQILLPGRPPASPPQCVAVGFSYVDIDTSDLPDGVSGRVRITTSDDTVWVGSVLVVRGAAKG